MVDYAEGQVIEVPYPFIWEDYHGLDADGPFTKKSWQPGVHNVMVYPDECEAVADGLGAQILTVVSVHKPGRFPARVFFTRTWRDPDGKKFGKGKCRVMTVEAFRRRARGYREEFTVASPSRPNETR